MSRIGAGPPPGSRPRRAPRARKGGPIANPTSLRPRRGAVRCGLPCDLNLSRDRPSWHSYRPTTTCALRTQQCSKNTNNVLRT
eukprot:9487101-Pyramimonas_sp.AAC.1